LAEDCYLLWPEEEVPTWRMSTAHDKSQLDLGLTGKKEEAEKKLSCTFLA